MRGSILVISTVLASFCAPAAAQGEESSPAGQEYLKGLHALAEWCADEALRAERELVYERVLLLSPGDVQAHKGLGHRRDRKRGWIPNPRRRSPKTSAKVQRALGEEFHQRLGRLSEAFVAARMASLQLDEDGEIPHVQRTRLAKLAPESTVIRTLNGEVQHEGRWILAASARTLERRRSLRETVQQMRRELPAVMPGETTSEIRKLGLEFRERVVCGDVRVASAHPGSEAAQVAADCTIADRLCREVVRCPRNLYAGYTVLLLESRQVDDFMRHPLLSSSDREFAKRLTSYWARHDLIGVWCPSGPIRRDHSVRQTVATMLRAGFEVSGKQAWLSEGMGVYLSHLITNTRLSYLVRRAVYDTQETEDWEDRMRDQDADWLEFARELMSKKRPPDVVSLIGKSANSMTARDMVISHALAAMLIEGYADRSHKILRACGKGEPAVTVLANELGIPGPLLGAHLRRWLDEVRELEKK